MSTPTASNAPTGSERVGCFLLLVMLALIIGGCTAWIAGDSLHGAEKACHEAYEHEYVYAHQPGGLSEDEYCDTVFSPPSQDEIKWHEQHYGGN